MIACFTTGSYAQTAKEHVLPSSLNEISGLEFLDKKTLVAINDGGNSNELFVLKMNGELIKRVEVINAKNKDWEDLATDGTYLYVADIGNNANKRENLCIYKIKIEDVLTKFEVKAEKIDINYEEQTEFPPDDKDFRFDAEGIAFHNDYLWLFTKTNTSPWDGKALVYKVSTMPGSYTLKADRELYVGDGGWWQDAITSVDVYNGYFYVMTYNRIIVYNFTDNDSQALSTTLFESATQKESILVKDEKTVIVADERQTLLGGGKLYYIQPKRD